MSGLTICRNIEGTLLEATEMGSSIQSCLAFGGWGENDN